MKRLLMCVFTIVCALSANAEGESGRCIADSAKSHLKSEEPLKENFAIHYRVNETVVDEDYMGNKEQIHKIKHYLVNSPRVDSITIYAWSSPDGLYNKNRSLSRKRASSAKRLLLQHSPDSAKLNSGKIKISPIAENWEGLTALVKEGYSRKDREKVLAILGDDTMGSDNKKRELKKLDKGRTWKYLADNYLPQLRAATWVCVWAEVIQGMPEVAAVVQDSLEQPYIGLAPLPPYDYKPVLPQEESRTIAAVKTNLLYDAVTAVNFAVEVPIGERWSIVAEDVFPWWSWGPNRNKYAFQMVEIGIEPRYWFYKKEDADVLEGHFVGVYGMSAKYDFQWDRSLCYQGEYWSTGVTYGYSLPVKEWLKLEFSASVGFMRSNYRHYQPSPEYENLYLDEYQVGVLSYFGPTKINVSMVIPLRFDTQKVMQEVKSWFK